MLGFEASARQSLWSMYRAAFHDVYKALKNHEFWLTLAVDDVKTRYSRTRLGRLWYMLSIAFFIAAIGGIYRGFFSQGNSDYFGYITVGYVYWLFVQGVVVGGCTVYISSQAFMLNRAFPASLFPLRLLIREFLVLIQNAIFIPIIFVLLGIWPGIWGIFISLIGISLSLFSGFWITVLLGALSLRFRDIDPIIASLMRIAFLATPILWIESAATWRSATLMSIINPFRYYLHIVRAPLLGQEVLLSDWLVCIGLALMAWGGAIITLAHCRHRLAYWL